MTVPINPTKYLGPNVYLANIVVRNREPTLADYRQPETGKNYVIFCGWQVGKDPTSGTEGDLWLLSKIVSNQGFWIKISSGITPSGAVLSLSDTANTLVFPTVGGNIQLEAGVGLTITSVPLSNKLTFALAGGGGAVDSFAMQTGTSPVVADGTGLVTFNGAVVAAGTNPVRTHGTGANTMALEVQISQAIAATDATKIGLSNFSSAHFSVDANGFVSLSGGGQAIDSVGVDAATGPGTNPVIPTVAGLITVTGGQIAAASTVNVIRTNSLAANTYTVQVQRSKTESVSTVGSNGVSHFDSGQFSVDANGFVSLPGLTGTFVPTLTFGGTSTGITYTTQEARYTQIGNMLFFTVYIDLSSKGSSTGTAAIAGLPVDVGGISSQSCFAELDVITYTAGYTAPFLFPITGVSRTAQLWQSGPAVSTIVLTDTNFDNTSNIRAQGFYFI